MKKKKEMCLICSSTESLNTFRDNFVCEECRKYIVKVSKGEKKD